MTDAPNPTAPPKTARTIASGWALVFPPSYHRAPLVECGDRASERGIWVVGLGWPAEDEIAHHKRLGVRAVPVRVVEATDDER